jgi:hypothetical protein
MVFDSPATPTLPMSILLSPVVRLMPALAPNPIFPPPTVLFKLSEDFGSSIAGAASVSQECSGTDRRILVCCVQ